MDICDDAYDGRLLLVSALFGKKDLVSEMSLHKDRTGAVGSGFIPPTSGNLRVVLLRTLFPLSRHIMGSAGLVSLTSWLNDIHSDESRVRFLLSLAPLYHWSSTPSVIAQLMTFLKERQHAALFVAAVAAQIGPFGARSEFINSLCRCGVHLNIIQTAAVSLGSMAKAESSNLNGHYTLTLNHAMDSFLLRCIIHRDCFISYTLSQRSVAANRSQSRGGERPRPTSTSSVEYHPSSLDSLVLPPSNTMSNEEIPQLSSFAYDILRQQILSLTSDNGKLQRVLQGLSGCFPQHTDASDGTVMVTASGLEKLVEGEYRLLNNAAVVAFSIKCTSSIKVCRCFQSKSAKLMTLQVARERCYAASHTSEFLQKLLICYRCRQLMRCFLEITILNRCFSTISPKLRNEGLLFKEFELFSLELQIPVVDLLEHFKQLLGDIASTSKMTDKEAKEKMVWLQSEASLPFSKYCMWCLAMKRELVAAPPQDFERFEFSDARKNFLKTGCSCSQCQLGDISQLYDKSSGCWSCIRNSHRGNSDIVVSFNLLEQHAAPGAPVELTFCCLSGPAYNHHHEPERLYKLLPTQPLELKALITSISENSSFEARVFVVRHWLVCHKITAEQLCALVDAGGSRRWKAEILVVAANRLTCPASGLSVCLSSIISNIPGHTAPLFAVFLFLIVLAEVEASHILREIGPLSCLNDEVPILNFDFDLKHRDERCALVCLLRMSAVGKLVLKEFVYTSRVQLKREELGHLAPWGDSLTGVSSNFMLECERKSCSAEQGFDSDFNKVISYSLISCPVFDLFSFSGIILRTLQSKAEHSCNSRFLVGKAFITKNYLK